MARLIIVIFMALITASCQTEAPPVDAPLDIAETELITDAESGLVKGNDFEIIIGNCTSCHSPRLIAQNRMSRQRWLERIRWMQKSQGLWQLAPPIEERILDYLENYYSPLPASGIRRAPLQVVWKD